MRCQVIKPFVRRGEIQNPGSILEVPEDALIKLTGYVEPIATADSYPEKDWRPEFKIWLENDQLRTRGVCDDLAGEIIALTADDLALQAKLLRECCGVYSGPQWRHLVEDWNERAAIMRYDGGLSREDAEYQAAARLRCLAFLDELRG